MSKRSWKWAGLIISGGVLLQVSGCGVVLVEWLLTTLASQIVQLLVSNLTATL